MNSPLQAVRRLRTQCAVQKRAIRQMRRGTLRAIDGNVDATAHSIRLAETEVIHLMHLIQAYRAHFPTIQT